MNGKKSKGPKEDIPITIFLFLFLKDRNYSNLGVLLVQGLGRRVLKFSLTFSTNALKKWKANHIRQIIQPVCVNTSLFDKVQKAFSLIEQSEETKCKRTEKFSL